MLIHVDKWLPHCSVPIRGIIHVGAHECEEQAVYTHIGVPSERVVWIEAIRPKVEKMVAKGFRVIEAVVSDTDNQDVSFHITNNFESSSILELDTHRFRHPHIYVSSVEQRKTIRLDTLIRQHGFDMDGYNFMNLDIQGAELKALKGMGEYLSKIDYIYTEANVEHLYKDCALLPELDAYLKEFGFERKLTHILHQYGWGDVLYVRTKN